MSATTAKSRVERTSARRILVVDDLEPIREIARVMLENAGYATAEAADGAEAVAAVRDTEFDLVLMDLHMPTMNGLTATRQIRLLAGPHATVPIIGISANVPLQHVRTLLAAGMNDHIAKPFRRADLLEKVDAWLNSTNLAAARSSGPPANAEGKAFDETCKLMGRPWALLGLTRLDAQIEEAFGGDGGRIRQQDSQMAGQAHALVTLAAVLGFSTLSKLCTTLEQACHRGRGVREAFEQARGAALQACKTAAGLRASPSD